VDKLDKIIWKMVHFAVIKPAAYDSQENSQSSTLKSQKHWRLKEKNKLTCHSNILSLLGFEIL